MMIPPPGPRGGGHLNGRGLMEDNLWRVFCFLRLGSVWAVPEVWGCRLGRLGVVLFPGDVATCACSKFAHALF